MSGRYHGRRGWGRDWKRGTTEVRRSKEDVVQYAVVLVGCLGGFSTSHSRCTVGNIEESTRNKLTGLDIHLPSLPRGIPMSWFYLGHIKRIFHNLSRPCFLDLRLEIRRSNCGRILSRRSGIDRLRLLQVKRWWWWFPRTGRTMRLLLLDRWWRS